MQLDLILRGQSNAAYLAELDGFAGLGTLARETERLLGFDGTTDRVRIVYDRDGQGGDTVYPGSAFLGDWMQPDGAGGWAPGALEAGFLGRMAQYRAEGMGDATALVWMHSEYDSRDPGLLPAAWEAAVRTDAGLVGATLGRPVPYLFVAAHPYGDGTDAGHQAIRVGMERLDADPAFAGRIAARAPDTDISLDDRDGNPATTEYGGAHLDAADAQLIAARIARGAAQEWAAFAKPGSPVALAGGNIPDQGPAVGAATLLDGRNLQVDVRHDAAGFAPLPAAAAQGLGWSVALPDGRRIEATGAAILDADSLIVSFAEAVPVGAVLDYAWGIGRVAPAGAPGVGNALTDTAGLPVWTPATGMPVAAIPGLAAPAAAAPAVTAAPALDPELALATGLARLAFGRPGTQGEVLSLQSVLEAGVSPRDAARALTDGPWFAARSEGLDDAAFTALLHADALGRAPSAAEAAAWSAALAAGTPREALAAGLVEQPDFATAAATRAPGDAVW